MPDYRRYRIPGCTYFFTVNLLERYPNGLLMSFGKQAKKPANAGLFTLILGWFFLTTCIVFGHYLKAMMIIPTAGESLNNHFPRHCP